VAADANSSNGGNPERPPSRAERIVQILKTLGEVIKEARLLIAALSALWLTLFGVGFATDTISFGTGNRDLGYEILVDQPRISAVFSDPLELEGSVRGSLGEKRAWLVLESKDGSGLHHVLGEIKPDTQDVLGGTWQFIGSINLPQDEYLLRIYVADAATSATLKQQMESGLPTRRIPDEAKRYSHLELIRGSR
jgi:hypothetical protein